MNILINESNSLPGFIKSRCFATLIFQVNQLPIMLIAIKNSIKRTDHHLWEFTHQFFDCVSKLGTVMFLFVAHAVVSG